MAVAVAEARAAGTKIGTGRQKNQPRKACKEAKKYRYLFVDQTRRELQYLLGNLSEAPVSCPV